MKPILILFGLAVTTSLALAAEADAARLYAEHCASCHGVDRLGAIGPARCRRTSGDSGRTRR